MQPAWDPAKDLENRREHGVELKTAIESWKDLNRVAWVNDSMDYEEVRDITLGLSQKGILYVVSTLRENDLTRIISSRNAGRHEQLWFFNGG